MGRRRDSYDLDGMLDKIANDIDRSLDRGMEGLDRGIDKLDAAMEKLDKKMRAKKGVTIRNVTQKGRGKSIIADGTKIIIDGVDVTEKLRDSAVATNVRAGLTVMRYIFKGAIFFVMLSIAIYAVSMLFDAITEAEHKPKTLDTKPPIVERLPDEYKPSKVPGQPDKRL